MTSAAFVDRVFSNLPPTNRGFQWCPALLVARPTRVSWASLERRRRQDGRRIMDLGHVGNVEFVNESRVIDDPVPPPGSIRFYQRIKLPLIGAGTELVEDLGDRDGWRVLAGTSIQRRPRQKGRSDYNAL